MTTWMVLKLDGSRDISEGEAWLVVGSHESNSQYWIGGSAAQALGEKFGAGEFLLLNDDRVQRLTVAERTEFYEAKVEDNSPPLNAEQIVEQTT